MKVRCINCKFFLPRRLVRDTKYPLSLVYLTKGICLNEACAEETLGWSGSSRSNKMSRIGEVDRYCKFFKENKEKW
ncbi:MAG: hypothetical protein ACTSPL_04290 [Candidatus Odinarchaeia archaeon]